METKRRVKEGWGTKAQRSRTVKRVHF